MTDRYDYLIIGGGIAGVTAAETIRENDNRATTIGIISEEPHLLYSRVLLPAYLKGRVSREQLFLRKIDDFTEKKIDLNIHEKVLFVDIKRKEVGLANRVSIGFEKLLIATGGAVAAWGAEDIQDFIFRLQTLDDADRMLGALDTIKQPLVIGASFISLEFLEIFVVNKISPTVIVRGHHFMDRILEEQGGEILHDNFAKHGITVQTSDAVKEVVPRENTLAVFTEGLRRLECDAVAVGIGIERNIAFLDGSGIELGEKGVKANEFLETNIPGIFTAGDMAEFNDTILGKHQVVGNWTNAFLQGQRAALNMVGKREGFKNVSAYSITNLGLQITAMGDCVDASDTMVRSDRQKPQYERFFLKNGAIVGAVLINRFQDKAHLARLVQAKTAVGDYRDLLSDFQFDIHEIPVVG